MKLKKVMLPIAAAILLSSCSGIVPVVGIDEDGKEYQSSLNQKLYKHYFKKTSNSIHQSVIPSLEKASTDKEWNLTQFDIGFGFKGEEKISNKKLGGNIGIRLAFKRKK